MRRLVLFALCLSALAGCGGGKDGSSPSASATPREQDAPEELERAIKEPPAAKPPGPVTAAEKRVIKGWSDALRGGHVDRAVSYWTVPALAFNGGQPLKLLTREAVADWNRSLPCGAKLTRTERQANYVRATFELTNRKGFPGGCDGLGNEAQTLFLIRDGKIFQWLRVPDGDEQFVPSEPS